MNNIVDGIIEQLEVLVNEANKELAKNLRELATLAEGSGFSQELTNSLKFHNDVAQHKTNILRGVKATLMEYKNQNWENFSVPCSTQHFSPMRSTIDEVASYGQARMQSPRGGISNYNESTFEAGLLSGNYSFANIQWDLLKGEPDFEGKVNRYVGQIMDPRTSFRNCTPMYRLKLVEVFLVNTLYRFGAFTTASVIVRTPTLEKFETFVKAILNKGFFEALDSEYGVKDIFTPFNKLKDYYDQGMLISKNPEAIKQLRQSLVAYIISVYNGAPCLDKNNLEEVLNNEMETERLLNSVISHGFTPPYGEWWPWIKKHA